MAPTQESRDADEQGAPKSLPADAILEILTRASLEALRACRCVCWEWYRLTHHPLFTSLHCERTQTISGCFMQCMKKARYFSSFVSMHPLPPSAQPLSLDFLPRNVKIEAVAPQGIMLCTLQEYASMIPRFYVCKPATRQWCRIPNPRTRYHTMKTAMVTCSSGRRLEYKIVRFSEPKPSNDSKSAYDLRCEIFNSRSRTWRRSNDIRLPPCTVFRSYDAAVTANGAVHWLTSHDDIFAFNVCNESWRLIPLPESARRDEKGWRTNRVLVKREGLLCLLLLVDDERLAIWVMADYEEQIWERREVVSLEALIKKDRTSIVYDLYSPSGLSGHGDGREPFGSDVGHPNSVSRPHAAFLLQQPARCDLFEGAPAVLPWHVMRGKIITASITV